MDNAPICFDDWEHVLRTSVPVDRRRAYREANLPGVELPEALERKWPKAGFDKRVSPHTLRHSFSTAFF